MGNSLEEDKESSAWKVQTFNASGWKQLRKLVEATDADVVLCQEHHIHDQQKILEKRSWLQKRGWTSVWSAAKKSDRGTNGGVMLAARGHIGMVG